LERRARGRRVGPRRRRMTETFETIINKEREAAREREPNKPTGGPKRNGHSGASESIRPFEPETFTPAELEAVPPRPWVLGTSVLRRAATCLSAVGGGSKSTLMAMRAISIRTGRPITGEKVWETGPSMIINAED